MIEIKQDLKRTSGDVRSGSSRMLWIAQRVLITLGAFLLAFYGVARIHGVIGTQAALLSFEEEKAMAETAVGGADDALAIRQVVNYSLWSKARIQAYERGLKLYSHPPLGLIKIPKLHIVTPVLEGTGDLALNVGVGRIQGTARPGERGNVGLAGHRDGFFRGL